jgi:hypothetical protein
MPTTGGPPGFGKPKEARAATAAALPAYTLGADGVFTANVNGALAAQDGVTLGVGDNFLLKHEAGARQPFNWVMQLIDPGSAGTPFRFQRAPGFPVRNGEPVWIGQGTLNQAKAFVLTTADPIDVNTTPLTVSPFSPSQVGVAGTRTQYIGGAIVQVTLINMDYLATAGDYIIQNTTTGVDRNITLPVTNVPMGTPYIVKDGGRGAAANRIRVTPESGTIDGAPFFDLNINAQSQGFYFDGTEWMKV